MSSVLPTYPFILILIFHHCFILKFEILHHWNFQSCIQQHSYNLIYNGRHLFQRFITRIIITIPFEWIIVFFFETIDFKFSSDNIVDLSHNSNCLQLRDY